ncbi:hypothetical protein ACKLNO_05570 [Neisseriaceae bacterium B1]
MHWLLFQAAFFRQPEMFFSTYQKMLISDFLKTQAPVHLLVFFRQPEMQMERGRPHPHR